MNAVVQRLKSKTYWAAIIGALLIILEQHSGFFAAYIPEQYRVTILMLWPILMITLREVTTTALREK